MNLPTLKRSDFIEAVEVGLRRSDYEPHAKARLRQIARTEPYIAFTAMWSENDDGPSCGCPLVVAGYVDHVGAVTSTGRKAGIDYDNDDRSVCAFASPFDNHVLASINYEGADDIAVVID